MPTTQQRDTHKSTIDITDDNFPETSTTIRTEEINHTIETDTPRRSARKEPNHLKVYRIYYFLLSWKSCRLTLINQ